MQPLLQTPRFEESEAKYDTWILDLFQFETVTPQVQGVAKVLKDVLQAECANPAALEKGVDTCFVSVDGQKLRTAGLLIRLTFPEALQNARMISERLATKLFESASEAKRIMSSLHYPTELDVRRVKKFRLVTDRANALTRIYVI